jgi:hypothetical protein
MLLGGNWRSAAVEFTHKSSTMKGGGASQGTDIGKQPQSP